LKPVPGKYFKGPYPENIQQEKGWRSCSIVESLLSKQEALSSNTSTKKIKEKKKRENEKILLPGAI
jgi:hypothetical protein